MAGRYWDVGAASSSQLPANLIIPLRVPDVLLGVMFLSLPVPDALPSVELVQVHGSRGDEQSGVPHLGHLGSRSDDLPAAQWPDAL